MGGKNSGYFMGPLETLGGAGLSAFVPGGAAFGVPMMTAGLGTTIGQAAGGRKGSQLGGLAGGLAGGLGEGAAGLAGAGPLSSQLGPGGSWRTALSNSPIGQMLGGGPQPGEVGSSVAAGVTPTPKGAPGAFPSPGAAPTPAGLEYQAQQKAKENAQQMAQGFLDQSAGKGPLPADTSTSADQGTADKKGDSSWYDKASKIAPIVTAASSLSGGGGGGQQPQQAAKPPVARPTPQPAQGASPAAQPMTQNVPGSGVARSTPTPPAFATPQAGPQHMAGPPVPYGNPMTGQTPGVMDTLRMLGGRLGILPSQANPPGIYQTTF